VGAALANEYARALRKRLTPQEVKLWVRLRGLKPLGYHFRRQAPIGRYIVDFVSFQHQLVIEADGAASTECQRAPKRMKSAKHSCGRKASEFFDIGIRISMPISLG
jgi:very-short-patch-repair endonuclease